MKRVIRKSGSEKRRTKQFVYHYTKHFVSKSAVFCGFGQIYWKNP